MHFRTMVKSLRLSWISRLLDGTDANWKATPNYFFNKYGGLTFLLKCNYNVNLFEMSCVLFYGEFYRENQIDNQFRVPCLPFQSF